MATSVHSYDAGPGALGLLYFRALGASQFATSPAVKTEADPPLLRRTSTFSKLHSTPLCSTPLHSTLFEQKLNHHSHHSCHLPLLQVRPNCQQICNSRQHHRYLTDTAAKPGNRAISAIPPYCCRRIFGCAMGLYGVRSSFCAIQPTRVNPLVVIRTH